MLSEHSLYVLTLTDKGVELHRYALHILPPNSTEDISSDDAVTEAMELTQLPTNLQEALRYDALDGQLQQHYQDFLVRRYALPEQPESEHPESSDMQSKNKQKYLRRYLRELDTAVCDLLENSGATLRVVGDADICSLYRQISEYPHLSRYSPRLQS